MFRRLWKDFGCAGGPPPPALFPPAVGSFYRWKYAPAEDPWGIYRRPIYQVTAVSGDWVQYRKHPDGPLRADKLVDFLEVYLPCPGPE